MRQESQRSVFGQFVCTGSVFAATMIVCILYLRGVAVAQSQPDAAGVSSYTISSSSFLGDAGNTDRVRSIRIQSDGTLVMAANIGSATPGGVTPLLLNGATSTSSGALIRLSSDGKSVLSVTRLATQVDDLAIDAADNLYITMWTQGVAKLDPLATQLLWSKAVNKAMRVDAGVDGHVAVLITTTDDVDKSNPGAGKIEVYDTNGMLLGSVAGKDNTLDLCLDSTSQTVVTVGWRQASVSGTPVQISYLRGHSYDGSIKYSGYDWPVDPQSERFINKPTNNMADTRGYRCTIGGDGKLYVAFEAAGGNHIFRYSPFDINTKAVIVGGDRWHDFYNTKSEHKTVVGRYEAGTGEYLLGQQFLNRLSDNKGNTLRVHVGALAVDALGRLYIGGSSAWGLPIPPHPLYKPTPDQVTYNHLAADPNAYLGGSWLMVMSSDFKTRLYTTRLTSNGDTHAVDARIISGGIMNSGAASIAFGGKTKAVTETLTLESIQTQFAGGTQDGWFAVIQPEGTSGTLTPMPTATPLAGTPLPTGTATLIPTAFPTGGTATAVPTAFPPGTLSNQVYLPIVQR